MQNQQNTGYSPQTIINTSNVASLQPVWSTPLSALRGTPVIVNGTVYVEGPDSIVAVNESTGNIIWTDNKASIGYAIKSRVGVTVDHGNVYAGTTNNYLLSINATTGALNWAVLITQNITGSLVKYQGAEATPLVYQGKVIVGETLGDNGVRGVLQAFNETNGALLWTFYTVPPDPMNATNQGGYLNPNGSLSWGTNGTSGCDICGGGAVWNVPAVDPNNGVLYFGTGNPYPFQSYTRSPNETYCALWTDSVIALNSTNGKMIWGFQEDCDDQYDLDQGMPVQLFNTTINGQETEVVGAGGKQGYYYELDALTGAMIYNVTVGIHLNGYQTPPHFNGTIYPSSNGGINTFSTYNPTTNMIYTEANNQPGNCRTCERNSTLYAINASSGAIAWNVNMSIEAGGVSSTNNLVFTTGNHTFLAFNAETGSVLWNYSEASGDSSYRWNWGPPSIVDGMVFYTTWGTNGKLLAFAIPETVNFVESGLPGGTSWQVKIGGTWYSSATNTISVTSLAPGTYTWAVKHSIATGKDTRFVPSRTKGEIIAPPQLTVDIYYSAQYDVRFVAKGNGEVSPSRPGWYSSGATVSILATPQNGAIFEKWVVNPGSQIVIGNATSSNTTAKINGPGTVTAKFS